MRSGRSAYHCKASGRKISIHAPRGGCDGEKSPSPTYHANFNPRTPRGVRPETIYLKNQDKHFNPRTPRGVRPVWIHFLRALCRFQSTHPAGGATGENPASSTAWLFQSTHPAGGATCGPVVSPLGIVFQSTHPAGGATRIAAGSANKTVISIHAPRGGCDGDRGGTESIIENFNPRTPRGVRRRISGQGHAHRNFNPRTPRGVRQQNGPFLGPFCRYKTKKITYFPENEETLYSNRKKMLLFDTFSRANLPGDPCSLALRSLHKKRIRWQIGRFAPKMLHFVFISIPPIIEPQAVLLLVHNRYQFCLKNTALRRIERAFKDGVLHSLPVVYTLLCDLPEALAPFCILGVDVISDQYEHMASLPQKRRIPIEVAAQMSGKQHSLRIWNHSP